MPGLFFIIPPFRFTDGALTSAFRSEWENYDRMDQPGHLREKNGNKTPDFVKEDWFKGCQPLIYCRVVWNSMWIADAMFQILPMATGGTPFDAF